MSAADSTDVGQAAPNAGSGFLTKPLNENAGKRDEK